MKISLLIVIVCVLTLATAHKGKKNKKALFDSITTMLETDQIPIQDNSGGGSSSAQDAFETVLDYIRTLKEGATQDIADAEQKQIDDAETCRANKDNFQNIVEEMQQNLDDTTAHKKWLDGEFTDTTAKVAFVQARIVAIRKKYDELKEQNCESSYLFVMDLKEHFDAIDLLQMLREEIDVYFGQNSTNSTAFIQRDNVKSLTERLTSFSRLFNKNQQLSLLQVNKEIGDLINQTAESRTDEQVGTGHVDNSQGALAKNDVTTVEDLGKFSGDLHSKMDQLIDSLERQLTESMDDLQRNSIQGAVDFAQFLRDMEQEVEDLRVEEQRKLTYLKKLGGDLDTAERAVQNAQTELNSALKTLQDEVKRCDIEAEQNQQRIDGFNDELDLIQQLLDLFQERIKTINGYIKNRVNEHQDTGDITNGGMKERVVAKNEDLAAQNYAPYI